jgi:hypothetical protein
MLQSLGEQCYIKVSETKKYLLREKNIPSLEVIVVTIK